MKQVLLHYLFPRQYPTARLPSEVLIRLHNKKKQLFGQYVQYDWKERKVSAYCAMGLLACQANMVNPDWDEHRGVTTFSNGGIIQAYGLSPRVADEFPCPASIKGEDRTDGGEPRPCNCTYEYIGDIVVHLNDAHHWTFLQIGLALKELGY